MSRDGKRCATCGYLYTRHPYNETDDPVGSEFRKTGQADWYRYDAVPKCRKLAFDLEDEWNAAIKRVAADGPSTPKDRQGAAVAVIQRPRPECQEWAQWAPDYSPKEHDAMMTQKMALDFQQQLVEIQRGMLSLQNDVAQQSARAEKIAGRRRAMDLIIQFLLAVFAAIVALVAAKLIPFGIF